MSMVDIRNINVLGIKLTDDKHQTIDLHSLHFQISILLSFIHKEVKRKIPDKFERRIMENARAQNILNAQRVPINNNRKLKIKKDKEDEKKK